MGVIYKEDLPKFIEEYPDYPEKGILYRDIMPLLADPAAFATAVAEMAMQIDRIRNLSDNPPLNAIAGLESRGFIFGSALAYRKGRPFIAVRKAGKLPGETVSESYQLEYGEAVIEVQKCRVEPGFNIILVDDLMATGGTMLAAAKLFEQLDCKIIGIVTLIELVDLPGRALLEENGYTVRSIMQFKEGK